MNTLDAMAERARRHPHDPNVWLDLSETLLDEDQPRRAIDAVVRAIRAGTNDERAWLRVGAVFRRASEDQRAVAAYRRAGTTVGASEQGWLECAKILTAHADHWAANVALQLAVDRAPESLEALLLLGQNLARLERSDAALEIARRAQAVAPENAAVLDLLSKACQACGLGAEAIRLMTDLLERRGPSPDVLVCLAEALIDEGRPAEAAQVLETKAGSSLENPAVLRWLGRARRFSGRHREALETLRAAVRTFPDDGPLRLELGLTLQSTRELEEARSALESATKLMPKSLLAWKAMSAVELELGRREQATKSLLEAAKLGPEDTAVRRQLSDLLGSEMSSLNTDSGLNSDLELVGVPELLQLLHNRQANGILAITVDSMEVELEFEGGMIVDVVRGGRIIADQPTRRLTPPVLEELEGVQGTEARVVDILQQIIHAQSGSAAFRPEARLRDPSTTGSGERASINPQFAVLEAMRRYDEERR